MTIDQHPSAPLTRTSCTTCAFSDARKEGVDTPHGVRNGGDTRNGGPFSSQIRLVRAGHWINCFREAVSGNRIALLWGRTITFSPRSNSARHEGVPQFVGSLGMSMAEVRLEIWPMTPLLSITSGTAESAYGMVQPRPFAPSTQLRILGHRFSS